MKQGAGGCEHSDPENEKFGRVTDEELKEKS
jgi:hypothetical protein